MLKIDVLLKMYYGFGRLRALPYFLFTGLRFTSVGRLLKLFGSSHIEVGANVSVGDNCWIQAVTRYKGIDYHPRLIIGADVSLSDCVHISAVSSVRIGAGTLIGSSVYIGDHSHGSTDFTAASLAVRPALRPLSDIGAIEIGVNVWIGDGVRILAGACIPDGAVIGANAVVKDKFEVAGLIAGMPARLIRKF